MRAANGAGHPAGCGSRSPLVAVRNRRALAGTAVLKDGYNQNEAGKKSYLVMTREVSRDKPANLPELFSIEVKQEYRFMQRVGACLNAAQYEARFRKAPEIKLENPNTCGSKLTGIKNNV